MRYLGGKVHAARWVARAIERVRGNREKYLEPFIGSAAVFSRVAQTFDHALGSDLHEDLVLLLNAVAAGWVPPEHVTREQYEALRRAEPSPLRRFVGSLGSDRASADVGSLATPTHRLTCGRAAR
jgi:hypothetical protein